MKKNLNIIGERANKAFTSKVNTKTKNKVLFKFATLIKKKESEIINQNIKDIKFAKNKGLKENLINRLKIDSEKINQIIKSIISIAKLKDPIDITLNKWKRPNGLIIKRVTVPIGVISVIYESRPNVTSDVSSLCFKSGSCVILRGGSESYFTNKLLANLFRKALKDNNVDRNFIQFIESRDRKIVDFILKK